MNQADLIVSVLRFALNSVLASLTLDPKRDVEDLKAEREAAAAMLAALNPRDAIQAALAARAVSAHHASMESFRRAALPDVPDALMRRLFASGMALSRMSMQMIKALEQRKGLAKAGAAADPVATILANAAAEMRDNRSARPSTGATAAGGTHDPMSSEARATGEAPPRGAGETATRPPRPGPAPTGLEGLTDEELEAIAAIDAFVKSAA